MNGLNDAFVVDATKPMTGMDGQLFVSVGKVVDEFMAEVNTFKTNFSLSSVDWQPVGSPLIFAVPTGYTLQLSFEEVIIRDDLMLMSLIEGMRKGIFPEYGFQGVLRRRDNQEERVIYRKCLPIGDIDLQNVTPGEIVKRNWSFRINSPPEVIKYINSSR